MSLKFGTDGVRGVANDELTPELVLALGRAAAKVLGTEQPFVVGRDPRVSGPSLLAALAAGLSSEGASVVDLGVVPTAAVAHAAAQRGAPGAMVSASHNPFADNGVKLFATGGRKLSDSVQANVESKLAAVLSGAGGARPTGSALGVLSVDDRALDAYAAVPDRQPRRGARSPDCTWCSTARTGRRRSSPSRCSVPLACEVTVINAAPDGRNINEDCGSTHPDGLRAAVVEVGANAGLAFDGDADRVLAVDAAGELVDGDQILAICALDMRERGRLKHDTLVVTVMANLGLRLAMEANGVGVVETQVGDRYLLEALEAGGWSLAGEQSGHILFPDLAPTGDGLLTGLQVLDVVARSGRSLAELGSVMTRLPQVLHNVSGVDRDALGDCAPVWAAVDEVESKLGPTGRVLLRPSGTEPLIRVMVEAPTHDEATRVAAELAEVVRTHLG